MSKNAANKSSRKLKVNGRKSLQQASVPGCAYQKSGTKFPGAISRLFLIPFLIFNFSLFTLSSCGFDVEDPTPPNPPQWVPKSLPEEWPERGIDANETAGISLEWNKGSTIDEIAHFEIYRAKQDDSEILEYTHLVSIEADDQTIYGYVDDRIPWFERFFYTISAIDDAGNRSNWGDTISYLRLPPVSLETMIPNGINKKIDENRTLSWILDYGREVEEYCITILNTDGDLILREVFFPSNYVGGREEWIIPRAIIMEDFTTYKWRVDLSAQFENGHETAGSESSWAYFVYEKD